MRGKDTRVASSKNNITKVTVPKGGNDKIGNETIEEFVSSIYLFVTRRQFVTKREKNLARI